MNAINLNSLATFNMDRLGMLQSLLQDLIPFVQQAYFVDAACSPLPTPSGSVMDAASQIIWPSLTFPRTQKLRNSICGRPYHERQSQLRPTDYQLAR